MTTTSNWKLKAGIAAAILLLIAALCFIIWYQHQVLNKQNALNSQIIDMKTLQDNIVRAQDKYATKNDLKQFAKDNNIDLGPIQKDLKSLHAEIKGINSVVIQTPGYNGSNIASTGITPNPTPVTPPTVQCPDGSTKTCPNSDPFGYAKNRQELQLTEPMTDGQNVPWGKVGFSAWQKKPWDLSVYPRQYKTITVLSEDQNGRHFIHNQISVTTNGKEYKLPIKTSEFVEQYPTAAFRFNPALYLGMDGGVTFKPLEGEFVPNLELSLFSYGKTKIDPTWSFLGLGIGYETINKNMAFVVSPINYNVGKVLPLVNNLYVGPTLSFDLTGNVGVLGGVRVGL